MVSFRQRGEKQLITRMSRNISYLVLVFVFAPSEDGNKPLSKVESIRFRRLSRAHIICLSAIACLLIVFVTDNRLAFSLVVGGFTVAASLLANYVKNESLK